MGQSFAPELTRLLREAGCWFVRHGRGDDDIWHSPISGVTFPVDNKILSRRTANGVLKQAGLAKRF
ncbi:MAG: type II toxin-antitoxin system HicA family toxin [Rubrivivax sp.]|nr:type II toxin-antitoxin system HicA family toxin [Rubrivivax sp.]